MRKKLFLFFALFIGVFTLAACGELEEVEIAMITDYGDIDDESFNQGTWEGIEAYAEEHGINAEYYRPSDVSTSDYVNSIDTAINDGAQIIITPGFLFEEAIYQAQYDHPDVKFVLLDAEPIDEDGNPDTADNTVSIYYEEHESGFLAGYAAVKEGLVDHGFMGGIDVPAVRRFGTGYIAGVHYAASQDDVEINFPDNRYDYLGTFDAGPDVETQAAGWYDEGIEVIFASAGGAGGSVMAAAADADAWMIGVDVDQSGESDTVLTSATKALAESVQLVLDEFYDDNFPGGEVRYLGADDDGVALPMETSRFETFTQEDYDDIYGQIASGEFTVPADYAELEDFFDEYDLGEIGIEEETVQP